MAMLKVSVVAGVIVLILAVVFFVEYLFDKYYADKLKDMMNGFGIKDEEAKKDV